VQTGPVPEVFSRPTNFEVAGLMTVETVQLGRILKTESDLVTVTVGPTTLTAVDQNLPSGTREVFVCIRAEDVSLLKGTDTQSSPRNHLPATVQSVAREGPLMRIDLDCGFPLAAVLTKQACEELALTPGDRVVALVKAPSVHLIPR
jgi:molybdate transport system ATP-binding protein